jgi:hydroxymethylpyrimidine/phosphomethylpyrimidine kinase
VSLPSVITTSTYGRQSISGSSIASGVALREAVKVGVYQASRAVRTALPSGVEPLPRSSGLRGAPPTTFVEEQKSSTKSTHGNSCVLEPAAGGIRTRPP